MMSILIIGAAFIGVAALVGGAALLFRGDSSSSVEDRLDVLAFKTSQGKSQDKSLLSESLDNEPSFLEQYLAQMFDFRSYLEQAEVPIGVDKFALIVGCLAVAPFIACMALGFNFLIGLGVGAVLATVPLTWVWWKRGARLAEFARQLPEALELISRALRAGHSLAAGMQLVSSEMATPIGTEFRRAYDEQNLGISLEQSLEEMTERMPNLDLRFFATAVILQRQTGGDLAEILDKIGSLIRERFKIYGQVQALTGEGRLSGIVLLALPPVLFVTMYRLNPDYVMVLFNDDMGKQMLAGAVVMQLIGAYVIRQIVDIRI
jgi:tight adherence protein B